MNGEKILKIPPCAVHGKCDILRIAPQKWAQGSNCGVSGQLVYLAVRLGCCNTVYQVVAIATLAGRPLLQNGVATEMKNKNKVCSRVMVTLMPEQFKKYEKLLAIFRKHCGRYWTMDYLLWSNLAEPEDIADNAVSCKCIEGLTDEERAAFRVDLKAAGFIRW